MIKTLTNKFDVLISTLRELIEAVRTLCELIASIKGCTITWEEGGDN